MSTFCEPLQERSATMVTQSAVVKRATTDTNRNLVRIFSICLSSLVFCYCTLAIRQLLEQEAFDTVNLLMTSVRLVLGVAALCVIFYPAWLARPLERPIDTM